MLTAELLHYRRRGGGVVPHLLDPQAPATLEAAVALIACVQAHAGRTRGELAEALRGGQPDLDARVSAGLTHLLLERCTFEVRAEVEPTAVRAALFDASAASWRTADDAGSAPWREGVVARGAAAVGLVPQAADAALFADLDEQQRLLAVEALDATELLYRYNTAQVQGLLLRAERVRLEAPWPEPRRLRQLLRYLKFFGLLYHEEPRPDVSGGAGAGLAFVVDGPLSVLESSTRYGLNLAEFFPALLLWEAPWTLEATVRLGRGGRPSQLRLQPHPWLRSHYPDRGQWVPRDVERFVESFNGGALPWRAAPAEALLALPGNRSLVPDFELRRAEGAAPVYLEHLLWPVAPTVAARLEQLAQAGRTDYLLACRGTPAVLALGEHPALVTYRRTLLPSLVRTRLAEIRP